MIRGLAFAGRSGLAPAHHLAPVSLPAYARSIHHVRAMLDRATAGGHELGSIARQMRAIERVRIGNGRVITTNLHDWAGQLTTGRVEEVKAVRHQLDSLDNALLTRQPHHWRATQLNKLDSVLRDPRFHPHLNPIQQLEGWLADRLAQILRLIDHHVSLHAPSGNPVEAAIVAILFLLLVAAVSALLVRSVIARTAASAARTGVAGGAAEPVTANAARQRAAEMAAAQSYREAFRYLFLGTLLALREAGLLYLRPGDTNREYLLSLAQNADGDPRREALAALVDQFDRVWYGHQPLTRAEYEHCQSLAARVVQPVPRGRTA